MCCRRICWIHDDGKLTRVSRCFHAFSRYFETLRALRARCPRDTVGRGGPLREVDARTFLDLIWATHAERFPAIGEEEDIRPSRSGRRLGARATHGVWLMGLSLRSM
jgi:hypothetical protein